MQSSVPLFSLFHMSGLKPVGIRLLESASERDPSDWVTSGPPGVAPVPGPTGTAFQGLGASGPSPGPPSASGTLALLPASSQSPGALIAGPLNALGVNSGPLSGVPGAVGVANPPSSISNSTHLTFGMVLGRLMPLLDDEVSHGHSEDDERSIAGDSWSVKSEYGSTLDGDDGLRTYELTIGGLAIAEGGSPPRGTSMGIESEAASEEGCDTVTGGERGRSHGPTSISHGSNVEASGNLPSVVGGGSYSAARGGVPWAGYGGTRAAGLDTGASSLDLRRAGSGRLGGVLEADEEREGLKEEEEEEDGEEGGRQDHGEPTVSVDGRFEGGEAGGGRSSSFPLSCIGDEGECVAALGSCSGPEGSVPSAGGSGGSSSDRGGTGGGGSSQAMSSEAGEGGGKDQGRGSGERSSTGTGSGNSGDGGEDQGTGAKEDAGIGRDDGEEEGEVEEEEEHSSVLGLRSHWESTYAEELATFLDTGEKGEIWFGRAVMDAMAEWTAQLAADEAAAGRGASASAATPEAESSAAVLAEDLRSLEVSSEESEETSAPGEKLVLKQDFAVSLRTATCGAAAKWRVLDIGTGNGLLLHALAKHGFLDLTGTDYCEDAVRLAHAVAEKANSDAVARQRGMQQQPCGDSPCSTSSLKLLVDDVLDTSIGGTYQLVVDKGTLDAINLHPTDAAKNRQLYKTSVLKLLSPDGLLVITSCNRTKDELVAEITSPINDFGTSQGEDKHEGGEALHGRAFEVVDYLRSHPTFKFGGTVGSTVSTVAFRRSNPLSGARRLHSGF